MPGNPVRWTPPAHPAKPLLSVRVPVGAIEFQKDRRIWNRHVALDDEHAEGLARLVELCNDLFVRKHVDVAALQKLSQLLPIGIDAGRIALLNESQFLIGVHHRLHMRRSGKSVENGFQYFHLPGASGERLDSIRCLGRICGIGNHNPVSVAIERKDPFEFQLPAFP
jgi:hypothetical protein